MANGDKMTFEQFKKLPDDVRQYRLYELTYNLNGRFAGKWVEKVVRYVGFTLLAGIITMFLSLFKLKI